MEMIAAVQPVEEKKSAPSNLRWWILLTVIIGTFLGRLDQTIVNLALPKIIDNFGISVSAAGWIATAYILANAIFVPIWGKLGDMWGQKKVYILGFSIFIVGSILAGLAWNLSSMIVFRVIQAIAGSADYPTAMAILAMTFREEKERSQALGIWSASFAAAAVFGPLIGGPLIDNFGWRSVFLINLPIGIIGLLMAMTFVKESVKENKVYHFDWWGSVTLGIALSTLVLVLDKGMEWNWISVNSIICYAITILFTWIFIQVEQRAKEPIVDLKFFKIPAFVNTLANNFIVFMGLMGSVFLIPIFAQTFLGYNATQSGILFIPMAAGMMFAAPLGGALVGKVKPQYVIAASTIVCAFGIYLFSVFIDPGSTASDITIPLTIMAFGMGFGMAQRTNIIASIVDAHEIGIASSVLALARNLAGAFGIAIFGTILNSTTENNIIAIGQNSVLHSTHPADYATFVQLIILKAQVSAYDTVFFIASLVVLVGAIGAFWIRVDREKVGVKVHVE